MPQTAKALTPGEQTLSALTIATQEYVQRHRAGVIDLVRDGGSGIAAAERQCVLMNGLLSALYFGASAASGCASSKNRVALLGLGGLGRGLVAVHSDIDLVFLADEPSDPRVGELVGLMLAPLRDTGLDVVYAVRGVEEIVDLARVDLQAATALVDLRRLTGDSELVKELRRLARREIFESELPVFLDRLEQDVHERHERFGQSIVNLEPDVKLGRGGLRDVDVGRWAARARWKVRDVKGLLRTGALLPREAQELALAREGVWRVRNLLHLRAQTHQDILRFADQMDIASTLGFCSGDRLAVEQFMQSYHQQARVIAQVSERLLTRARPVVAKSVRSSAKQLGPGVILIEPWVELRDADQLQSEPGLALRLFEVALRTGHRPGASARDAIAKASQDAAWCERLRRTPEVPRAFLKLLTHKGATGWHVDSILTDLHAVGLLVALVPEFASAVGRVRYDIYNVHTVDVHSIRAVDLLRSLMRGDHTARWPTASQIAADARRPSPLFLAALVHELSNEEGTDPSEGGAQLAREVGKRLGFNDGDANHAAFLVRNQMKLYYAATRRDLVDPGVISEVAGWAKSVEQLRDLYLLTFVDLWATNSAAMTDWKAELLAKLGELVARHLEGDPPDTSEVRVRALRREVRVGFMGELKVEALEAFLDEMPARYLLSNEVEAIREHAFAAVERTDSDVVVREVRLPHGGRREIVIVVDERSGFLADVAVCLAKHGVSVIGAQVYSRKRRRLKRSEVVGVFELQPEAAHQMISDTLLQSLQEDLSAVICGRADAEALRAQAGVVRNGHASGFQLSTEVVISNDASEDATLVDVYANDGPGVLFAIARAFRDLSVNILFARLNTEGLRVVDAFYVTDADGRKIVNQEDLRVLRERILHSLHQESCG